LVVQAQQAADKAEQDTAKALKGCCGPGDKYGPALYEGRAIEPNDANGKELLQRWGEGNK
jgi:hypothetical protein